MANEIKELKTEWEKCPECRGHIKLKPRSNDKGLVLVYGRQGPSKARNLEFRYSCQIIFGT